MSVGAGSIEHMFESLFGDVVDDALVGEIEQLMRDEAAVAARRLAAIAELVHRTVEEDDERGRWAFDPWDNTAARVAAALSFWGIAVVDVAGEALDDQGLETTPIERPEIPSRVPLTLAFSQRHPLTFSVPTGTSLTSMSFFCAHSRAIGLARLRNSTARSENDVLLDEARAFVVAGLHGADSSRGSVPVEICVFARIDRAETVGIGDQVCVVVHLVGQ